MSLCTGCHAIWIIWVRYGRESYSCILWIHFNVAYLRISYHTQYLRIFFPRSTSPGQKQTISLLLSSLITVSSTHMMTRSLGISSFFISYHISLYLIISHYISSYHYISDHRLFYTHDDSESRHITILIISLHISSYIIISYHILSYLIISYHISLYLILSHHISLYLWSPSLLHTWWLGV